MISCHNSGTHSIQCLMEIINTKDEEDIIKISIQNDILQLSYVRNIIIQGYEWDSCDSEDNRDYR